MLSAVMRATADELMGIAGGRIGGMIGGPYGSEVGFEVGKDVLAPLVDKAAHKIVGKKRKVSKYSKEFGTQLKKLKLKHPRTDVRSLMSKAHKLTKKVMK
jgi:hypothetical protein